MSGRIVCDLRSDTVTRPTQAMFDAMMQARVGDDVYGEDESVNALEAEVAALLGMEAALFVPSGTMANQIALALHTRPGDSVVTEAGAHHVVFEAGAAAAFSGLHFELVPLAERLADAAVRAAIRPEGLHNATTTLLVVENTHNVGGGRVLSTAEMQRIAATAAALGLARHCDGARLWNAAAVLDVPEKALVSGYDSVAVCFSKGLGAPVGSALCGSRALVARGRKLRKRFGGGMRQAGYLAAAASYALSHHRQRLSIDHSRAAQLAAALGEVAHNGGPVSVNYPDPGTNMVYFRFAGGDADAHIAALAADGVRIGGMGGGWLRAVFHLDVSDEGAAHAVSRLVARAKS